MKTPAVVFTRLGETELQTIDMPDPRENDVQVRTLYSSISSGTEGWSLRNLFTWQATPYPCVPGYQRTGEITRVGSDVKDWKVGDRVMATIGNWQGDVRPNSGSHSAVSNTPARELFRIPEGVSEPDASATVVVQVGYNAAYRADLEAGDWVVVFGDGIIGQFAAQAAQSRGCRVILVGHRAERIALAARHSADAALPDSDDLVDRIRDIVGAKHVTAVLDSVQGEEVQKKYLDLLEHGRGQIVYCGFSPPDTWANMAWLQQRELTTHYISGWTRTRMEATLRLMAEGKLRVAPLVTHRVPFTQADRMYRMILEKSEPFLGIVIEWKT